MYKIKLTPYRPELGTIFHRQTAGHQLVSRDGRYRFYIDEPCDEPDFWVVQGKGVRQPQTCKVAPGNTIFLATEPRSVLVYPKKYLRQFGMVCTCQEQTQHPNVHLGPAILPWFVGYTEDEEGVCHYTLDYDQLSETPQEKTERKAQISVITSNKAFTQGHLDRIRFVEKLKAHFGDRLDVFGRGFRPFADKWDVLAPYRYHIAIENSSQRYYWTEKLSDCYLANTYPFYYGCENVADYFPDGAFTPIDIHNADRAINTIEQALQSDLAAKAKQPMLTARRLVLEKYNMFEYIAMLCDQLDANAPKEQVTIQPCHSMDDWHNFVNYTFKRNFFKLKMKMKGNTL